MVAEAVEEVMAGELTFELGVEIAARRKAAGLLSWTGKCGKARRGTFDHILDAAGRKPSVDGLDLNLTGLEGDEDGVPVFDPRTLRCGTSSIFIVGDVNDDRPVLHEASLQGEMAGRNAARLPRFEHRTAMPNMVIAYSDPDIAVVGPGFDEGREGLDDRLLGQRRPRPHPGGETRRAAAGSGVQLGDPPSAGFAIPLRYVKVCPSEPWRMSHAAHQRD